MMLRQCLSAVLCCLIVICHCSAEPFNGLPTQQMSLKVVAFEPDWLVDSRHAEIERVIEAKGGIVVVDFKLEVGRVFNQSKIRLNFKDDSRRSLDLYYELRQGIWSQQLLNQSKVPVLNANRLEPLSKVDANSRYLLPSLTPHRSHRLNLLLPIPNNIQTSTLIVELQVITQDDVTRIAQFEIVLLDKAAGQEGVKATVGIYQPSFSSVIGLNKGLSTAQRMEISQVRHCERAYLNSLGLQLFYQSNYSAHQSRASYATKFDQLRSQHVELVSGFYKAFPYEAFDDVAIELINQSYRRVALAHGRLLNQLMTTAYQNNKLVDVAASHGFGLFQSKPLDYLKHGVEWFNHETFMGSTLSIELLADAQAIGMDPWFINMSNKRVAAGFYLWRSGAAGYLQWQLPLSWAQERQLVSLTDKPYHQRFIYNGSKVCNVDFAEHYGPTHSDALVNFADLSIDAQLLALAVGLRDWYFMNWLQTIGNDLDTQLFISAWIDYFHYQVPVRWRETQALFEQHPRLVHQFRDELVDVVARHFSVSDTLQLEFDF